MCENPLDPVNSLDFTDIWCGPWLLKFLCVLFCGKSTKSAGVAKRQWRLVSNDRNGVETLRFPPDPLKRFCSERQVFYCQVYRDLGRVFFGFWMPSCGCRLTGPWYSFIGDLTGAVL